ncbi:Protein of unknown function [Gryllus bimaculatus]|nr:Protein of unknown function [Gryllus bimaculatus]
MNIPGTDSMYKNILLEREMVGRPKESVLHVTDHLSEELLKHLEIHTMLLVLNAVSAEKIYLALNSMSVEKHCTVMCTMPKSFLLNVPSAINQ